MPGLGQGGAQGAVVGGYPQRQRPAGGETAGADISAAVKPHHLPIARIGHIVADGDAVLCAEGIDGEPDVAARPIAQLPQHGGVALVRPDDHAAAEKEQNGPPGRLSRRLHHQTGEALDHLLLIIRLVVGGHEKSPAPVGLFDGLQQILLRQGEGPLRPGEPIGRAQQRSTYTHCISLLHFRAVTHSQPILFWWI